MLVSNSATVDSVGNSPHRFPLRRASKYPWVFLKLLPVAQLSQVKQLLIVGWKNPQGRESSEGWIRFRANGYSRQRKLHKKMFRRQGWKYRIGLWSPWTPSGGLWASFRQWGLQRILEWGCGWSSRDTSWSWSKGSVQEERADWQEDLPYDESLTKGDNVGNALGKILQDILRKNDLWIWWLLRHWRMSNSGCLNFQALVTGRWKPGALGRWRRGSRMWWVWCWTWRFEMVGHPCGEHDWHVSDEWEPQVSESWGGGADETSESRDMVKGKGATEVWTWGNI